METILEIKPLVHSEYRKSTVTEQHSNSWMVLSINVFTFWVPCSDVRYDFRIKMMFGSSSPPVVCRRARVLSTLVVFAYIWWCPTHNVLFFCLVCLHLCVLRTLCCQFFWISLRKSLSFINVVAWLCGINFRYFRIQDQ